MKKNQDVLEAETVAVTASQAVPRKIGKLKRFGIDVWKDKQLYLMMIPGFVILFIFAYVPMYGLVLSFKDYTPVGGIFGSPWIDPIFTNFTDALYSRGFWTLFRNTVVIGTLKLIFGFPAPIILALMLNELANGFFKKFVQTVSYLPYFISWVIVSAIAYMFLATDYGIINTWFVNMGLEPVHWYAAPEKWWSIITITSIWKGIGWGTITFLAGIASISDDLYEAAQIDGANRWQQTWHITLPGLGPVVGITFALSAAKILQDDFDQMYALVGTNSELYTTAEVLGSWSYRIFRSGWSGYGITTAVGLMQSILSLLLMLGANWIVKKTGNPSIW